MFKSVFVNFTIIVNFFWANFANATM